VSCSGEDAEEVEQKGGKTRLFLNLDTGYLNCYKITSFIKRKFMQLTQARRAFRG